MPSEIAGGIGNHVEFATLISLTQNGAKSALRFVTARGSINNERIGAVFAGVIDNRLRRESRAQFIEGLYWGRAEFAATPMGIFMSENIEGEGDEQKVPNVLAEKVGETKELTDLMHIGGWAGIFNSCKFIGARENSLRGKSKTEIGEISGAKETFSQIEF